MSAPDRPQNEFRSAQHEGTPVATLATSIRPHIGAGFRLQWEPAQDCHVLLYPEGMVKLNGSAGEIMRRCDGERSIAAIVEELQAAFNASGLEPEVLSFVEIAGKQRWLVWESAP